MMKKLMGALVFVSTTCFAMTNQIEYMQGRGIPRCSVQADGSADQEGTQGAEWSADFLHKAANHFYLGVGGGEFHSGDNVSGTFVSNANTTISSKMTSILALGRIDLSPNPKLVTYAIAGLGWVKNTLSVTSAPTTIVDSSKATLGYAAGLGVEFPLSDRLFIGAEARYQGSERQSYQTTPDGTAATGRTSISVPLSVFLLSLKAGFKY
jgi:opacity protein-like surface antigen